MAADGARAAEGVPGDRIYERPFFGRLSGGASGFIEGRNVTIKYRWARGEYGRLPGYVDELIGQKIDLLVALGGDASARAAQKAASSVPVVFAMGGDPIQAGLVKSFNTPGGNMTGVVIFSSDAETKRLSLLHELAPTGLLGVLVNPEFPPSAGQVRDLRAAAPKLGRQLIIATASDDGGLDAALASLLREHVVAAQIASDPYFDSRRERIIAFVVYQFREYVVDGGLLSYGPNLPDAYRQAGVTPHVFSRGPGRVICPYGRRISSTWCSI